VISGLVRAEGLEPPQLASPEPKSGASTNSATPAADAAPTRAPCASGALYTSLTVSRHRKKHDYGGNGRSAAAKALAEGEMSGCAARALG
jgi:hypothetical protein